MGENDIFFKPVERDLRLDLLRGVGLWMVFLDHTPVAAGSWLTLRNYGFSDAAELFIFISGYLVGYIHAPVVASGYFPATLKRLWKRAAQLYVAYIMLFLLFTAQVARAARRFDNPMYEHEFNIYNFLQHPDELIGRAITMRYSPVNLDILPLFIALVFASPLIVWCLVRRPNLTLLGSISIYVLSRWFDWNIESYPPGKHWYFNPFCWQLLFVLAAWCGAGQVERISHLIWSRAALVLAAAWLLFAFAVVTSWHIHSLEGMMPKWMIRAIYPIDKTDLDMLRLTHFLALATLASFWVSPKWKALTSIWFRPPILCGQHSLPVFCYSVLLSFSVHWLLTQYGGSVWDQIAVSFGGVLLLTGSAWLLDRTSRIPDPFAARPFRYPGGGRDQF